MFQLIQKVCYEAGLATLLLRDAENDAVQAYVMRWGVHRKAWVSQVLKGCYANRLGSHFYTTIW